jgi:hypothetical protein
MAGGLMNRRRALVAMAMAAGGIAGGKRHPGATAAETADDKIALAKVPVKIKEAASKALPRAKWTGATKSVEDGEVTYELEGEDAAKVYVWVELTADGKVNEVGSEIVIGKVPQVVTAALKKKFPRFQVASSYEARKEGKVIRYDFEGKRPRDKKEITVSVSVDGKEIEIDES